jgi:hypothetical protein
VDHEAAGIYLLLRGCISHAWGIVQVAAPSPVGQAKFAQSATNPRAVRVSDSPWSWIDSIVLFFLL